MIRARVGSKWGSDAEAVRRGHCISGFIGADLMHVHESSVGERRCCQNPTRVVSKHSDEAARGQDPFAAELGILLGVRGLLAARSILLRCSCSCVTFADSSWQPIHILTSGHSRRAALYTYIYSQTHDSVPTCHLLSSYEASFSSVTSTSYSIHSQHVCVSPLRALLLMLTRSRHSPAPASGSCCDNKPAQAAHDQTCGYVLPTKLPGPSPRGRPCRRQHTAEGGLDRHKLRLANAQMHQHR